MRPSSLHPPPHTHASRSQRAWGTPRRALPCNATSTRTHPHPRDHTTTQTHAPCRQRQDHAAQRAERAGAAQPAHGCVGRGVGQRGSSHDEQPQAGLRAAGASTCRARMRACACMRALPPVASQYCSRCAHLPACMRVCVCVRACVRCRSHHSAHCTIAPPQPPSRPFTPFTGGRLFLHAYSGRGAALREVGGGVGVGGPPGHGTHACTHACACACACRPLPRCSRMSSMRATLHPHA
jgi:hypothetical protein